MVLEIAVIVLSPSFIIENYIRIVFGVIKKPDIIGVLPVVRHGANAVSYFKLEKRYIKIRKNINNNKILLLKMNKR